jgi:Lon protease-like protein
MQPEDEFLLPIFPLPNLVFFPETRLPLHIFEPRYRLMVEDALEGSKRIGMILLKPGWELSYYAAPPVHEFGTVGTIEQSVALPDGRFNIVLNGTVRYRILESIADAPYRTARVVTAPERQPASMEAYALRQWLTELAQRYLESLPGKIELPELRSVKLDALTNALIMSLDLSPGEKQILLELDEVAQRCERVGEELQKRIEGLEFLAPYRRNGDPNQN